MAGCRGWLWAERTCGHVWRAWLFASKQLLDEVVLGGPDIAEGGVLPMCGDDCRYVCSDMLAGCERVGRRMLSVAVILAVAGVQVACGLVAALCERSRE